MDKIEEFIKEHWSDCVLEGREDGETRIGLPYQYSIPATEMFDCMYYWDTYFANLGLLRSGRAMMAKYNVDNMLYLVNKYGFMPNGSNFVLLNRSQPPFLSEMVRDIYDYYKDSAWLRGAYEMLKKEYEFWMIERITPAGLNRYGGKLREEYEKYRNEFADVVAIQYRYNANPANTYDKTFVMVDEIHDSVNQNGDNVKILCGYTRGQRVEYEIDSRIELGDIEQGDLIQLNYDIWGKIMPSFTEGQNDVNSYQMN